MSVKPPFRVFVTRLMPQRAIDLLKEQGFEITQFNLDEHNFVYPKDVSSYDAVLTLPGRGPRFDADLLDRFGRSLKVISTVSVGYDHIDISECKKRGIKVGYTPDVLTETTAETTMALLLCTARRLLEANKAVYSGEWGPWRPLWMCGQGLLGSTVGIIGLGRIGFSVAEKIVPFKPLRIVYCNRRPTEKAAQLGCSCEFVSLAELFRVSDFVLVCCALSEQTRHLIDSDALRLMKSNAVVINTSRGDVVDQEALYDALLNKRIGAAGLDVTTPEPLPTDHKLLGLDNCVVLPHIGSATVNTRQQMAELAALNLIAALHDQPMPAALC